MLKCSTADVNQQVLLAESWKEKQTVFPNVIENNHGQSLGMEEELHGIFWLYLVQLGMNNYLNGQ